MNQPPNKSMMTNRRCPSPLLAKRKLGRAAYAPPLLSAAVAYLRRYMSRTISSVGQPMGYLFLLCLVSCVGPSSREQVNDYHKSRCPIGTFIKYATCSGNWEAQPIALMNARLNTQSEERRVGKECRS